MPKCPNCGANVLVREKVCPYCGADHQSSASDVAAVMSRAAATYRRKAYAEAVPLLSGVIEMDPGTFDAYFYLADSLAMLGRHVEAIEAMKKAAAIYSGSAVIPFNIAVLLEKLGRYSDARVYFERALASADTDDMIDRPRQFKRQIRKKLRSIRRRN